MRLVHSDPNVMGGVPVFVGTRVPIALILDSLAAGERLDDLVESYSFLTPEHIDAAKTYVVRANPEATSG